MTEAVSQSAYARRRGWHRSRVTRLKAQGFPVGADGMVPVDEADRWCGEHLDARRQDTPRQGSVLNALRAEREAEQIRKLRLENAKLEGDLIDRDLTRRVIVARAKMESDAWIGWANRAAADVAVAAGCDIGAVFPALERSVRDQLITLASTRLKDLDRAFAG